MIGFLATVNEEANLEVMDFQEVLEIVNLSNGSHSLPEIASAKGHAEQDTNKTIKMGY